MPQASLLDVAVLVGVGIMRAVLSQVGGVVAFLVALDWVGVVPPVLLQLVGPTMTWCSQRAHSISADRAAVGSMTCNGTATTGCLRP